METEENKTITDKLLTILFAVSPFAAILLIATHWGLEFVSELDYYLFILGLAITLPVTTLMCVFWVAGHVATVLDRRRI